MPVLVSSAVLILSLARSDFRRWYSMIFHDHGAGKYMLDVPLKGVFLISILNDASFGIDGQEMSLVQGTKCAETAISTYF